MNLVRRKDDDSDWNLSLFNALDRELGGFFDDFWWLGKPRKGASTQGHFAIDVEDKGDRYIIEADLPGFKKEDLKVEIDKNYVTLKAERKRVIDEKKQGNSYYERSYGLFERHFQLASEVSEKEAKANLKNGVLTLELPKKTVEKAKQIEIKVEGE
jgi:HSP20 family protein